MRRPFGANLVASSICCEYTNTKGAFNERARTSNRNRRQKTAVRAGATGNNVRYVLIGSVALAILAWILVEYFVRP
jgi:hypothetical protein